MKKLLWQADWLSFPRSVLMLRFPLESATRVTDTAIIRTDTTDPYPYYGSYYGPSYYWYGGHRVYYYRHHRHHHYYRYWY